MARKDALARTYNRLIARRDEIRRSLAGELRDLGDERKHAGVSDDADAATESLNNEMASQIAQLESRELAQIERALDRLRKQTYGLCEICTKRIPVARMNALPYSTMCIDCQRQAERRPGGINRLANWQNVYDREVATGDSGVSLADLDKRG